MSLAIRIFIQKTGATKTMPFEGSQSVVGEVIREIRNKIGEGGSDHGLFLQGDDMRNGKWLENNKTLNFYDGNAQALTQHWRKEALAEARKQARNGGNRL